jgi:hypothetical protein
MKGLLVVALSLGLVVAIATTSYAHSGGDENGVLVIEPTAVVAGAAATFAGTGLEPESSRSLELAGGHLVIDLGPVRTDALGTFQKQLVIPAHLPADTYEVRTIGHGLVSATIVVTTTAASSAAVAGDGPVNDASIGRAGMGMRIVTMLALTLVILLAGLFVAWRGEKATRVMHRVGRP